MKKHARYGLEWVASVFLVIFALVLWTHNRANPLQVASYKHRTMQIYSRVSALGRTIRNKKSQTTKIAPAVGTATALLLSSMRHQGAISGVIVDRAEINSIRIRGGNWQYLDKSAEKSRFPGLQRIQVHINGQWNTLAGLLSFLSVTNRYPAEIHQIDVSDGYFKVTVNVYGS